MFEKYEDDIVSAIISIKRNNGQDDKLVPEDALIANQVLFATIKSFVFQGNFDNATLHVNQDNGHFSFIKIPEYLEPLDENQTIREEEFVNVLAHKYKYPEYPEDLEDVPEEPWEKGGDCFFHTKEIRLSTEARKVIKHLSDNDELYNKIFSNDSTKMIEVMDELNNIEISRHEKVNGCDIENLCSMASDYSIESLRGIFGHRYVDNNSRKNYVVAKNKLGVVGIACLSVNHGEDEGSNGRGWSLSYISVSPHYRKHGIATRMLNECFNWAREREAYILRTSPSDVGRKYTFDKFTLYAKKYHPDIPFVARGYGSVAFRVNKLSKEQGLTYKTECGILQNLLELAHEEEKNYPESYFPHDNVLFSGVIDKKLSELLSGLNRKSVEHDFEVKPR